MAKGDKPIEQRQASPNENCLMDMQCPKCSSYAPFTIEVTTTVKVYDSGTDTPETDVAWDDTAYCTCIACGHGATVAEFKGGPAPHDESSARRVIAAIERHEAELNRLRSDLEKLYVPESALKVGEMYLFRDKYHQYHGGKLENLSSPVGPNYVDLRVDVGLSSGPVLAAVPGNRLFPG